MKSKVKALVVEDDLQIQEQIMDVLQLLGHEHDWAESQQQARDLIEQNTYQYVLADLEIPARTGRGFANIEYGKLLIEQIQQINGRGITPVIVMTGHHEKGLNMVMDLMGNGAMDFISKPFGDGTTGKSLPQAIRNVLKMHRKSLPKGTCLGDLPKPFEGGVLAFYPNHIELAGETILESQPPGSAPGNGWLILHALSKPQKNSKLPRLSAPRLAKAIDPSGQLSDGAINSCVHTLRTRIAQILLEESRLTVSRNDVIANKGKGYHLADWLIIEHHDENAYSKESASLAPEPQSNTTSFPCPSNEDLLDPLTERQTWILNQLRSGTQLTRKIVEDQFSIGDKQAKRELTGLTNRDMVSFMRKPRPGYYVLKTRQMRQP